MASKHCYMCSGNFKYIECCIRIFPCDHSYCQDCIKQIFIDNILVICPTCKQEFQFKSVEDYITKDLFEFSDDNEVSPTTIKEHKPLRVNKLPYEGHCEEHELPNHFKCNDCSVFICGTCTQFTHKKCVDILPVTGATQVIKNINLEKIISSKSQLTSETASLNKRLRTLAKWIECLKSELEETTEKKQLKVGYYQRLILLEINLKSSTCNKELEYEKMKLDSLYEDYKSSFYPSTLSTDDDDAELTTEDINTSSVEVPQYGRYRPDAVTRLEDPERELSQNDINITSAEEPQYPARISDQFEHYIYFYIILFIFVLIIRCLPIFKQM